jgi:hypothetical protein
MMVESIESWCCRNDQRAFCEVLKQRLEIISLLAEAAQGGYLRYNASNNAEDYMAWQEIIKRK